MNSKYSNANSNRANKQTLFIEMVRACVRACVRVCVRACVRVCVCVRVRVGKGRMLERSLVVLL